MKVQCDVCEKAPATILCCADEASLCADCDTRVHAANKLASKHQRLPLLYPPADDLPSCDICQEKTGYFFCLEDRALLCRTCDYSIHSRNTLAANHKRFLVSGVCVGLQAITAGQPSENIRTCSPSQGSSPTAQGAQLSSPTSCPNLPKNTRTKTSVTAVPSKNACLVPGESSSPMVNMVREEVLGKVPTLPSAKQEQLSPAVTVSVVGDETLIEVPTLPTAKQTQTAQEVMLAQSRVESGHGSPSKIIEPATRSLPSASIHKQMYMNGSRQPQSLGTSNIVNKGAPDFSRMDFSTFKGAGGGNVGRSSISEYLTESIPGWRVDELLNLPDIDAMYNYTETGLLKSDAATVDADWPAEGSVSDSEGFGEAVAAEVPRMPSPPTASGISRATRPWGLGKSLKEQDLDFFIHTDDILVVPDIGGVSSPQSSSPSSLPQKRRRPAFEFW